MKFTIKVGDLISSVQQVAATLDSRGAASHMYLRAAKKDTGDVIYLYSTDMTTETLTKVPAEVEEEGQVLVDHKRIIYGTSGLSLEADLSLTLVNNVMKAKSGKTKFTLSTSSEVDKIAHRIKSMPLSTKPVVKLEATDLGDILRKSTFCILNDKTGRYTTLTGLCIRDYQNGQEILASDSAIAVRLQTIGSYKLGRELLIPHGSIQPLSAITTKKKNEEVEIIISENTTKVFFKFGDTIYGTECLTGKFPEITPIFESNVPKFSFNVETEELKALLNRAHPFTGKSKIVELEVKDKELHIKAKGNSSMGDVYGEMSDSIEVEVEDGETARIGVNIDYLLNIVTAMKSVDISIGMTKEDKPLIVKSGDSSEIMDTKYILMGVKLGN